MIHKMPKLKECIILDEETPEYIMKAVKKLFNLPKETSYVAIGSIKLDYLVKGE